MVAQELCRAQGGAGVWDCAQSLVAPFLAYAVPRTPPAGLLMPPDILDLGCHSLTLEEAFSCTRTSASFTSNKTSCRRDEGEEAPVSTALSSVFNQTLTRVYPNAEVMKHSQSQLFQVSSVLPFFPPSQCFHTSIFSQADPRGSNNSDLSPKALPESGLAFPEFSKCFPACGCILFLHALSYPVCPDASNLKKPHRGGGVANIQPSQVDLELAGKNIHGRDPVSLHSLPEPFPGCPQPCHSPALASPSPAQQGWLPPAPLCHHTEMEWEGGNNPWTHEKNSRRNDSAHGRSLPHSLTVPTLV